jgi:hypothetical protein
MSVKNSKKSAGLVSPSEVAEMLGITVRHVRRLPLTRIDLGHRTIRYQLAEVEQYVQQLLADGKTSARKPEAQAVTLPIRQALGAIKTMTSGTIQCEEHPKFRFIVNQSMRDGAFAADEETHTALGNETLMHCPIELYLDKRLSPGAVEANSKTIEALIRGILE